MLEFTAIKTAYRLDRQTPTIDCTEYLQKGGIAERLMKRKENFVESNKNSILIRHGETLKYSQGRRIRTKKNHRDKSSRKEGWKASLKIHKKHTFFSDLGQDQDQGTNQDNIQHLQQSLALPGRKDC